MGRKFIFGLFALVLVVSLLMTTGQALAQKKEPLKQFVGILIYRTGPFAAGGSGFGSGWEDFMTLRNMQGGVNGVMYEFEECETAYNTARGVECYERLKDRIIYVQPFSTGITYALIDRATKDKIPVHSMGYGRADASVGSVFPYVFTTPTSYWSQNSAKIKFIARQENWNGRMAEIGRFLKGKKIANLHIDVPYGQETKPMLDALSERYGFKVRHFPVPWPGIDQKAQWMDIVRRYKADWVLNRNWGVSCTVPLKEAARLGFPRDKILGVWWCGSEEDVLPAGPAAKGYFSANFHGSGRDYPLVKEIIDKVYGAMKGHISFTRVGSVYWSRGIYGGVIYEEAMRAAHKKFGIKVLTGEEMQWGMEHLDITEERIKELGLEGFMAPVKTSCDNHEGGKVVLFQQWDGEKWVFAGSESPMTDFVWERHRASAAKYAKEKKITPRNCK
jgi:branched-chain amino acid transport system substrate-binding protein